MANRKQPKRRPGRYGYYRDADGCHDILFIVDTQDNDAILMGIYFWDEPDTKEAAQAERKAKQIVRALNSPGCWIDQFHVVRSTLKSQKQIAVIWSVEDVQKGRPDLNDDQAWKVLQLVQHRHWDDDQPITRELLQVTANDLFPTVAEN